MVKRIVAMIIGLLLVFGVTVYAADLQLGTEVSAVIERDVDYGGKDADYSARYYDVTLEQKVGDWLKITPKAGINTYGIEYDSTELNSTVGWNIGIDAEAAILKTKYADLAGIGSYRFSRTGLDETDVNGTTTTNINRTSLYVHEYEFGVKVSKDLNELGLNIPVKPYIGIVYSDLTGEMRQVGTSSDTVTDIDAEDNFGIRLGVTASPKENLLLSLDAKFGDQTAIGGKVSYKF